MKIKGRRQSSNVEVKKNSRAKQGRRLPADNTVVTAQVIGKKAGVNSMESAWARDRVDRMKALTAMHNQNKAAAKAKKEIDKLRKK